MAAGEAENPRVVMMPRAYNAVFGRLMAVFVLGSLAVGINVPRDDAELASAFSERLAGSGGQSVCGGDESVGDTGVAGCCERDGVDGGVLCGE